MPAQEPLTAAELAWLTDWAATHTPIAPTGPLTETLPRNNYGVTDGATVFVKLARTVPTPPEWGQLELDVTGWLRRGGVRVPTALTGTVQHTPHGRAFTAWRYLPTPEPFAPHSVTGDALAPALTDLQQVHRLSPWPGLRALSPRATVHARVAQADARQRACGKELLALLTPWLTRYEQLLTSRRLVPSHGDPHVGNLIGSPARWCDWESARLPPVEWDAAALDHNLHRIGGNPAWPVIAARLHTGEQLDPDTLLVCGIVKAVSAASYLLLFPDDRNLLDQRLQQLQTVRHGQLPPRLAPHPGR